MFHKGYLIFNTEHHKTTDLNRGDVSSVTKHITAEYRCEIICKNYMCTLHVAYIIK